MSVLGLKSGYTVKYGRILLSSEYEYSICQAQLGEYWIL